MTVGMYFPIMGTMKGAIVPESGICGHYNLFHVPDFIVLFGLLTDLTPTQSFSLNIMLSTAAVLRSHDEEKIMAYLAAEEVVTSEERGHGTSLCPTEGGD
jgi:hypothetical protein